MIDSGLYCGDCLDILPAIEPGAVSLVACDLPYGTTANAWDSVVPLDRMWSELARLATDAFFVLTAAEPFATELIVSAPKGWFRYDMVWVKNNVSGFLCAQKQPLRVHERVLVFSKGTPLYRPQKIIIGPPKMVRRTGSTSGANYGLKGKGSPARLNHGRFPTTVLEYKSATRTVHPTQKPVRLFDWIIRSYSAPGDLVLDLTMGSGTTGVACAQAGRRFLGIEKDPKYFAIAQKRIMEASR